MRDNQTQLDAAMDARRVDLRMTWREVAEAAELSLAGLSAIRRGERQPSTLSRRRLEDALQWERGSIEAVMEGHDPTAVNPDETETVPRTQTLESRNEPRFGDLTEKEKRVLAATLRAMREER